MTPDRWRQIEKLFQSALELPANERAEFLIRACGDDESLRREVESLLAYQTAAGSFIQGAVEEATEILAETQVRRAPGQQLGPYRIINRLGAGGMGEVYLAQDSRLGRKVALKLLPALYTGDRDRVRRFTQEARAASALNHPSIITIFEIGQIEGEHFIVTEFIDGRTLRQRIGEGRMNALESLDVISQIASALAAAHEAGIIHRDIKPENVMLRRDGYVKVLDFGLAKLTERTASVIETDAPTAGIVSTEPGTVMGTVAYMSPEQARGLEVDPRTDTFSLGVMSYELLSGRRPFTGATPADVISAILSAEPQPLQHSAPESPEALGQIIAKALRKEREERYQTTHELLAELKSLKRRLELQAEMEVASGADRYATQMPAVMETVRESAAETGGGTPAPTTSTAEVLLSEIRRHKLGVALTLMLLVAAIAGAGFWLYRFIGERQTRAPFNSMHLARLTATGRAIEAAISPDGKYVAYVAEDEGKQSLWLRQTGAASNVQIALPSEGRHYSNPAFSRDGDYIYYLRQDGGNARAALYQLPVLGGEARKLIEDISTQDTLSNIGFSPDGKQVAFVRLDVAFNRAFVVMNVDGSGERTLATRVKPVFLSGAAWSPDGKTIACVEGTFGRTEKLIALRVADGTAQPISRQEWAHIVGLAWLADGGGLAISAADKPGSSQLWQISYPGGEARRITNDLNSYLGVSLSADSSALVTVQRDESEYLWIAPDGDTSRARKIIAEAGDYDQLHWTPDGRLLYVSVTGAAPGIRIINADGAGKKQLTTNAGAGSMPSVSPDGRYIYFGFGRSLWRVESDGGNPKQLLSGGPLTSGFPQCSPDGKWLVFYGGHGDDGPYLWRVSTEGGEPQQLTHKNTATRPVISPDGRWIAGNYLIREPNAQFRIAIFPFEGGEPIKTFDVFGHAMRELHWTPDGRAITYLDTRNGVSNIVAQPIDGAPVKQLTNFQSDYIFSWNWSRDGKHLACSRGPRTSDVVLISNNFR